MIDAALVSARPSAAAKNILLHRELGHLPQPVLGDGVRLQQVVWNLISNAIKFTPKGGEVTVRARQGSDHTQIEVTDTGIGIREDFLPFVFDRFRQSDGSTTRSHGGLGLGLSISRHLVEMHGGMIAALSTGEGQGAKFTVTLPLNSELKPTDTNGDKPTEETHATPPLPVGEERSLEGVNVVAVDDEPDSRRVLVRLLLRAGATVREAGSVAQALEILQEQTPDLLISDIAMPVEDGYSLIGRLRASSDPAQRNLPAIALTAFARSEDQARSLEAGFQRHLAKPFEPVALLTAIKTLASGHLPGETPKD